MVTGEILVPWSSVSGSSFRVGLDLPVLALVATRQKIAPPEWARIITNRVFLVHCKNDKTIRIDCFRTNVTAFDLSPSQAIVLSRGGHTYLRAELLLASTLLRVFDASFPLSIAYKD